jgi:hypothetical protein
MSSSDAQKSEVHDTTADAATSPLAPGDRKTTRQAGHDAARTDPKMQPEPPSDVNIVRDDTSDGGPLVVESNDPDLAAPPAPRKPATPERPAP